MFNKPPGFSFFCRVYGVSSKKKRARRPRSLIGGIGQKSHLSGPLNGPGQLPLIFGGRSRHPARQDFAPLADELAQQVHILVVDVLDFIHRKIADLTPLVPTTTRHRNPSFPPGWSVYL